MFPVTLTISSASPIIIWKGSSHASSNRPAEMSMVSGILGASLLLFISRRLLFGSSICAKPPPSRRGVSLSASWTVPSVLADMKCLSCWTFFFRLLFGIFWKFAMSTRWAGSLIIIVTFPLFTSARISVKA